MSSERKILLMSGKGLCNSTATFTMMPPRFYAIVENNPQELEKTQQILEAKYGIVFKGNEHSYQR
jgi:hypothetical protein